MVEVLVQLRFPSLVGFLIYLGVGILGLVAPVTTESPVPREALDLLKNILIIPFEIAIYRLLILGEATSAYNFAISAPRFQRLLGWTIGMWALITLPPYLPGLIAPSEGADAIATIATTLVVIIVAVRIAILFPAIAVDVSGASLRNALADTKGRSWLILKSYLIVLLPALIGVLAIGLISDFAALPAWWSTARMALDSSLEFLMPVLVTVVASRLFDWIGHRVKGLPG